MTNQPVVLPSETVRTGCDHADLLAELAMVRAQLTAKTAQCDNLERDLKQAERDWSGERQNRIADIQQYHATNSALHDVTARLTAATDALARVTDAAPQIAGLAWEMGSFSDRAAAQRVVASRIRAAIDGTKFDLGATGSTPSTR
ncbi:MAG: hypothetical protein ACOH1Y_11775 [Propionicimonas sp.]